MMKETLHILLAAKTPSSFGALALTLKADQRLEITHAETAERSMQIIKRRTIDIAVVAEELQDKSGLQFVREVVADNPFINCALVSPLYPPEFHEQTEGLGIFMQLPVEPDVQAAIQMLELLEKINQLQGKTVLERKQQ
jgi:DNA-binding NarL/FixJ family response regulator